MPQYTLTVNGKSHTVEAEPTMPLLWVLRDQLELTGTKYSCGIGQCGTCTVHLNGAPVRSCSFPASAAVGQPIVTIEGLSANGDHPVQAAWEAMDVPQCGYCQAGQIMSAAALLQNTPNPTDEEIDSGMTGNICRCGTYKRIRAAIHHAAATGGSK
jgi:isoquinoline 1-oxidoreductase subunit alpha